MNPRYPIYIISKGRWTSRLTSKMLERAGVPYHIVIEPQEYDDYAAVINPKKILVLPFANLGQGSIPARNWVWTHAISMGARRHWILDDNIQRVYRLYKNKRYEVFCGAPFAAIEDFVERYHNVPFSGFNYSFFCPEKVNVPPFTLNTRIYSAILIENNLPFRWRGKYNEDTDLSLRVLLAGYCTILVNAFLIKKMRTLTMKGGNEEIYKNGTLEKTMELVNNFPDIVKHVQRYGRDHHYINYRKLFKKNKLIKKKEFENISPRINNYGMVLVKKTE